MNYIDVVAGEYKLDTAEGTEQTIRASSVSVHPGYATNSFGTVPPRPSFRFGIQKRPRATTLSIELVGGGGGSERKDPRQFLSRFMVYYVKKKKKKS